MSANRKSFFFFCGILCANALQLWAVVFCGKPFHPLGTQILVHIASFYTRNWKLCALYPARTYTAISHDAMASTKRRQSLPLHRNYWQTDTLVASHRKRCAFAKVYILVEFIFNIHLVEIDMRNDEWNKVMQMIDKCRYLPLSMYGTASSTNRINPHFGVILSCVDPSAHTNKFIHCWSALYALCRQQQQQQPNDFQSLLRVSPLAQTTTNANKSNELPKWPQNQKFATK